MQQAKLKIIPSSMQEDKAVKKKKLKKKQKRLASEFEEECLMEEVEALF